MIKLAERVCLAGRSAIGFYSYFGESFTLDVRLCKTLSSVDHGTVVYRSVCLDQAAVSEHLCTSDVHWECAGEVSVSLI
jgi:hypothetical protein